MYWTKVRDIADLKQRISNAIDIIDEAMLQQTRQVIKYSFDVLLVTNGALMRRNILKCCIIIEMYYNGAHIEMY